MGRLSPLQGTISERRESGELWGEGEVVLAEASSHHRLAVLDKLSEEELYRLLGAQP